MNELNLQTSPYLLQHATNPVHWKPWSEATLQKAKQQNKLIIISIGYSACHWCHVMEHESFENQNVATIMNQNYISIKVDREERPDIDAVYMKAVQLMTGRGGWPMNVICLPDGRPVWGGTYFKTHEWINYLDQIQELYIQQPQKLLDYAQQLTNGLQATALVYNNQPVATFNDQTLEGLLHKWQQSFDLDFGGMARAPKFMMPTNYQFLLRYAYQNNDKTLLDFVNLTLTKMAYGGLFDAVGGGFSRYSVDIKWHVPHFEKMLYDNAQLVSLYANAYKLTKNELYKTVVEKTLLFVEKEFLSYESGFYSALDADSLTVENKLEEGAFYVWTKTELQTILKTDFELFAQVFNINDLGYWEHNNYVLIQHESVDKIAQKNNLSKQELAEKKQLWEALLYNERQKRKPPGLDDKCLCSWNALMLNGFIDAYKAFQNEHYLKIALQSAHFISTRFLSENGNLFHNYKNKKATINGYLEDYSFVIEAFINLYQVTLNEHWLHLSKQLVDYCLDYFYDQKSGFFRFTSTQDAPLVTTHFEIEDNVIPASNSVIANNLVQLSLYFNLSHYEEMAQKMLHHVLPSIDYPSAFSNWLNVFMHFSSQNKELAVCGDEALTNIKKINAHYLPNCIVAATAKPSSIPFLENRFIENKNLFYICQNKTCTLPDTNLKDVLNKILIQ